VERVTQHREVALLKLASWAWGKPRIGSLLSAFTDLLQLQEDDAWDILDERTLANGDLVRLRVLGKIVGQPRFDADLETYRKMIQARGLANVSKGRASDVFAVLNVLIGAGEYQLRELGDATLLLTVHAPSGANLKPVPLILPDVRAAGVGLHFVLAPPTTNGLTFGSSVSGGGGDLASSVSGGGDDTFSVRIL